MRSLLGSIPWRLLGVPLCAAWLAAAGLAQSGTPEPEAPTALVTVNGAPITAVDLEFLYFTRRIPDGERAGVRDRLLNELIDQKLMAAFLESRQTAANPAEIDARVASVRALIEQSGRSPDEVLQKLGITDDMLRRTLALPLAWKQHVRQVVTDAQAAEYFEAHRRRFDGSKVRVSQIVRTLPQGATDADRAAATAQLKELRSRIESREISFVDAAKQHSQSPSKAQGGDVGWITAGTRLPHEIAAVAFTLAPGEVGGPFVTRYGVHLVTVTEVQPGDLSLEDVRDEVLAELGEKVWREQLAQERAKARIEQSH
jgi:parvulin-like peptidyl-prolyl isomerase